MRTELLFESCPFLTSANVTLSRLGFADGAAYEAARARILRSV